MPSTSQYRNVPSNASISIEPFKASIPNAALDEFKTLLRLSKLPPPFYEGNQEDRRFGVTSKWMANAKSTWLEYDWRKAESYINSFPNYTTNLKDEQGAEFTIHFVALFSQKKDAVPVMFFHGWPGSFLEFLPLVKIAAEKYTPESLPFHIVVPSLPGYTFSSPPPLDRNYKLEDVSFLMDKLAQGLGFGSGYVAQGGDLGSRVSRVLGANYPSCKAVHLNMNIMRAPSNANELPVSDLEKQGLERASKFMSHGRAYATEHGTRPSTIGHVLSSSPLALLAWIGEKFLEWTDKDPTLEQILDSVTLWWLTETFPTAIYPYRTLVDGEPIQTYFIHKPLGFSWLPKEISPTPKSWLETTGNLVFFRQHSNGGHFAAFERPETILRDVHDFIDQVWPNAQKL